MKPTMGCWFVRFALLGLFFVGGVGCEGVPWHHEVYRSAAATSGFMKRSTVALGPIVVRDVEELEGDESLEGFAYGSLVERRWGAERVIDTLEMGRALAAGRVLGVYEAFALEASDGGYEGLSGYERLREVLSGAIGADYLATLTVEEVDFDRSEKEWGGDEDEDERDYLSDDRRDVSVTYITETGVRLRLVVYDVAGGMALVYSDEASFEERESDSRYNDLDDVAGDIALAMAGALVKGLMESGVPRKERDAEYAEMRRMREAEEARLERLGIQGDGDYPERPPIGVAVRRLLPSMLDRLKGGATGDGRGAAVRRIAGGRRRGR